MDVVMRLILPLFRRPVQTWNATMWTGRKPPCWLRRSARRTMESAHWESARRCRPG